MKLLKRLAEPQTMKLYVFSLVFALMGNLQGKVFSYCPKVTLDEHNNLIFEAERERNKLEIELNDLKGLARLTKKKELESRIATKNEEIRTLKAGLSGIVKQHGFATVQDFYTAFYTAQCATDTYQKEGAKWEYAYGEKITPKAETMHEKIQRYQEKADRQNASQPYRSRDKWAR